MPKHYESTLSRIEKYNQPLPLVDYLLPLVGNKKEIKIADIGSGPFSIIGSYLPGVSLEIIHSDKQDFVKFWQDHKLTSVITVQIQNMEKLTYEDNTFDIVHCVNALDHTHDARSAVQEMIRICKDRGWVYISCSLDQLSTGYKHYWNAKADGTFINDKESFKLTDFGFNIKFIDNGGESRYNQIIATFQKYD